MSAPPFDLRHGDCLDLLRQLPDASVDAIVTDPPYGLGADPYTGSGSTGKAAMCEGFRFIGFEREADYIAIARARIEHAHQQAEQHRDEAGRQPTLWTDA